MRVEEAKQRDIGKKRARIGPDAMDYLGVSPGDVIQISGKKSHVQLYGLLMRTKNIQIQLGLMVKQEKMLMLD